MKKFQVDGNLLAGALFLTLLCMGLIGVGVVLPVACIQALWNFLMPRVSTLPTIEAWQAVLLWLAGALVLFLSGIIRIKVEKKGFE